MRSALVVAAVLLAPSCLEFGRKILSDEPIMVYCRRGRRSVIGYPESRIGEVPVTHHRVS